MTERDVFAAVALACALLDESRRHAILREFAEPDGEVRRPDAALASYAYRIADQMLLVRGGVQA